ncbi:hypothetical protein [Frankia sp. R82]|uniref:hypothetical protein n=1 Tax=Frankia sp. R82 TaxID=2950553 RepID=UPI002044BB33|nr:hypothetical protein [Frankia sp. R82]MCM3886127.1 hypothetical protein [Frankia sp. R82]
MSVKFIRDVIADDNDLLDLLDLLDKATQGRHGGDRRSDEAVTNVDNINVGRPGGTSQEQALRRLRKEMELSELMSLGRALEALETPKARERQGARTDLRSTSASPDAEVDRSSRPGKVSAIVAKELGLSSATYERLRAVYKAATDPAGIRAAPDPCRGHGCSWNC